MKEADALLEESPMLPPYKGVKNNTMNNSRENSDTNINNLGDFEVQEINVNGKRPSTTLGGHLMDLENSSKYASRAKSSTGARYNKGYKKLMPADVIYERRTSS